MYKCAIICLEQNNDVFGRVTYLYEDESHLDAYPYMYDADKGREKAAMKRAAERKATKKSSSHANRESHKRRKNLVLNKLSFISDFLSSL